MTSQGVYEVKKGVKKRAHDAGDRGEDGQKVRAARRARRVIESGGVLYRLRWMWGPLETASSMGRSR